MVGLVGAGVAAGWCGLCHRLPSRHVQEWVPAVPAWGDTSQQQQGHMVRTRLLAIGNKLRCSSFQDAQLTILTQRC